MQKGIELAKRYEDIVVAVNVGNEALVEWNDHMVPLEKVIAYVRQVKGAIAQPVTVADNYEWWIRDGAPLAAEVDFLGVHTYPAWEEKEIDEALPYTIENIDGVRAALPDKPIAILEAGWATAAIEFSERASEANQARPTRRATIVSSTNGRLRRIRPYSSSKRLTNPGKVIRTIRRVRKSTGAYLTSIGHRSRSSRISGERNRETDGRR